jgi:Flp pilus assembly CpaF family ATPase
MNVVMKCKRPMTRVNLGGLDVAAIDRPHYTPMQVPTCDQIGYALNVARALAKSLASPNACQEVLGVVILEDTRELKCAAPDCVALRTKPGVVALADLVHSTLRLRPDRIIVGEVRGPEALDMFKAWNTGHRGGITTVHATLAAAGLHRLEQLVQEAVVTLPRELAIDLVVLIDGRTARPM